MEQFKDVVQSTEKDQFLSKVAIPYFKELYGDLLTRSQEQDKGISKLIFLSYC